MSGESSSFSLEEIRKQLETLGYVGVGDDRLHQFQSDLSRLLSNDTTTNSGLGDASYTTTDTTTDNINVLDLVCIFVVLMSRHV